MDAFAGCYGSPSSNQQGTESPRSDTAPGSSLHDACVRRRRRRVAIEVPPDQTSHMDKAELKKLKNRIAAARARSCTQRQVEELKAVVAQLQDASQQQQRLIEHLRTVIRAIRPGYDLGHGSQQAANFQGLLSADPMPFHAFASTPRPHQYPDTLGEMDQRDFPGSSRHASQY